MAQAQVFSVRVPVGTSVNVGDHFVINGSEFTVQSTNDASTYRPWIDCALRQLAP
jgi:hypothetical protein